jgi:hypothetical protein
VTLVGAQLLGVRVRATPASATPTHWWDQAGGRSLWHELALEPTRRSAFADAEPPHRLLGVAQGFVANNDKRAPTDGVSPNVVVAQEDKAMEKVGKIGKFLQIGSVVQDSRRSPRWFSLPGSWRAPRIQIMRYREQAGTAEREGRPTLRDLVTAGSRGGW